MNEIVKFLVFPGIFISFALGVFLGTKAQTYSDHVACLAAIELEIKEGQARVATLDSMIAAIKRPYVEPDN